jgi:hypothetical protein
MFRTAAPLDSFSPGAAPPREIGWLFPHPVREAEEQLDAQGPSASDVAGEIGDDWLAAWREGVQNVTDAQLRSLWSRLLAGEIRRPGHVHLGTMAVLRIMSQEDALTFAKIARWVLITDKVIRLDTSVSAELGVRFLTSPDLKTLACSRVVKRSAL